MEATAPINARLLQPGEVAERFVAPEPLFGRIASQNHVVLLGPRGSGKTTLLTMLTQPAQRVWRRRQALEGQLPYLGVLVRANLTWSRQLNALRRTLPPEQQGPLLLATYSLQASLALLRFMQDELRHLDKATLDGRQRGNLELELSGILASATGMSGSVETFAGLKRAMVEASQQLWRDAREGVVREHVFSAPDILGVAGTVAEALEELRIGRTVALLLDELELCPREVRQYLRTALRDADERVLIKMSVSPVDGVTDDLLSELPASEGNDYLVETLTYPRKTDGYDFTFALIGDLARRAGAEVPDAAALLGRSHFALRDGAVGQADSYSSGRLHDSFKRLAAIDPTFASYAQERNVDLDAVSSDEFHRAATVRKWRDIVLVRERYLLTHGRQAHRSTKSLDFYAGRDSVAALLEGNPRWVVHFMTELAPLTGTRRRVNPARQATALNAVLASLNSRIATAPVAVDAAAAHDPARGRRVLELLALVGSFFQDKILNAPFNPEPPLTFLVDDDVAPADLECVADAVSHGAIIRVPGRRGGEAGRELLGERFRLCYLVAAKYQLPPILGREVKLSTIRSRAGTIEEAVTDDFSLRLFI